MSMPDTVQTREEKRDVRMKRSIIFHFIYEWDAFKLSCRSFFFFCVNNECGNSQACTDREKKIIILCKINTKPKWMRTLIECQSGNENDDWKPDHLGSNMTIYELKCYCWNAAAHTGAVTDAQTISRKFTVLNAIVTLRASITIHTSAHE